MVAAGLVLLSLVSGAPASYPEDTSLTVVEYVRAGMPSPDRQWSPADYGRAAALLEKIGGQPGLPLPRFNSEKSGPAFSRITAEDNIAVLRDSTIPVGTRIGLALELMTPVRRILLVYLAPAVHDVVLDRELAECMGLLLNLSAQTADLLSLFMAELPAEDPQRETRLEGLHQAGQGLSEVVGGVLDSISEKDTYREAARRSLAGHLANSAAGLLPHMSGTQRLEVVRRLAELAEAEADPQVREALLATHRAAAEQVGE